MNTEILLKAANEARGLAIDAIYDKASGHMGLPLGCAEIGAALYGELLNVNPSEPRWLNRDRSSFPVAMVPCSCTAGCT